MNKHLKSNAGTREDFRGLESAYMRACVGEFPETPPNAPGLPAAPDQSQSLTAAESHAQRSTAEFWFDVCVIDPALGIGRLLGRVQAPTRALAEVEAARLYPGQERFVSLSTRAKSSRARPRQHHNTRRFR